MDEKRNRRAFLKDTIAAGAGLGAGYVFLSGCAANSGKGGKSAAGNRSHIAYCGLDCFKCEAFIATRDGNEELKVKIAKEWSERYAGYLGQELKPEDINCRGCKAGGELNVGCRKCPIRKCCTEKKLENCAMCGDYETCEILNGFFTVPSHKPAKENLERIRKKS